MSFVAIVAIAVIAVIAIVAGCGDGSSTPPSSSTATDEGAADAGSSGSLDPYSSPLAEFFGLGDETDQEAEYMARENERLAWVANCMAQQGFEFEYPDTQAMTSYVEPDGDGPEPGTRAWMEIYGFGISTQAFDQTTVGPDLVGYPSQSGTAEAAAEPGDGYLDGLSEEERNAYYAALYGDDQGVEWDESLSDAENQAAVEAYYATNPPSGCDNQSYEQASLSDPFQRLYEDFGDELSSMYERVLADPQIVAALDEVARCTNDAGFAYVDEQTTNDDIYRRLEPVNEQVTWPGDSLTDADFETMTDAEVNAVMNRPAELTAEGKALLAEIQQYEVDLALALHDCGGGELIGLYQKVSIRLEQEFVDAHRAELEAYKSD